MGFPIFYPPQGGGLEKKPDPAGYGKEKGKRGRDPQTWKKGGEKTKPGSSLLVNCVKNKFKCPDEQTCKKKKKKSRGQAGQLPYTKTKMRGKLGDSASFTS